jgi:hypothetical protein
MRPISYRIGYQGVKPNIYYPLFEDHPHLRVFTNTTTFHSSFMVALIGDAGSLRPRELAAHHTTPTYNIPDLDLEIQSHL